MPFTELHGYIQKAKINAETLKRTIREAPDGWQLWLYEDDQWVYVGKFTRKTYVETFLIAHLGQEDR